MVNKRDMRPNIKLVENSIIILSNKGKIEYSIQDVAVIGEYTTEEGPVNDDWFLVFVRKNGEMFQLPIYDIIANTNTFFEDLSKYYKVEIKPKLANSTAMRSNLLWPPKMIEMNFLRFVPNPGETIGEKVVSFLKGPLYNIELSEEVAAYIQTKG